MLATCYSIFYHLLHGTFYNKPCFFPHPSSRRSTHESVPLHQAFVNNFQAAKEALAEATAQVAEKAATGVMELAERSTRIALNVHFNAPVVFLPQSSTSANVIVADLGLLSVKNHFTRMPSKTHIKIPPIVDIMTVELRDLNMYR